MIRGWRALVWAWVFAICCGARAADEPELRAVARRPSIPAWYTPAQADHVRRVYAAGAVPAADDELLEEAPASVQFRPKLAGAG